MNRSLDSLVTLPEGVLGYLEWSSGVLWINLESDEFHEWLESDQDKRNKYNIR